MRGQQTFSDMEYSRRKRVTKREEFLKEMNEIIPWEEWVEYIRPFSDFIVHPAPPPLYALFGAVLRVLYP